MVSSRFDNQIFLVGATTRKNTLFDLKGFDLNSNLFFTYQKFQLVYMRIDWINYNMGAPESSPDRVDN